MAYAVGTRMFNHLRFIEEKDMENRKTLDDAISIIEAVMVEPTKRQEAARAALDSGSEDTPVGVINPENALLRALEDAGAITGEHRWVQTCHSDTCSHASHDPGYYIVHVQRLKAEAAGVCWRDGSGTAVGWDDSTLYSNNNTLSVLYHAYHAETAGVRRDAWRVPQDDVGPVAHLLDLAYRRVCARDGADETARQAVTGAWLDNNA